jgi:hypothetical protein
MLSSIAVFLSGVNAGTVALTVGGAVDDQSVRAVVSRSTADWASSGSVVMPSHSAGSRLDTQIVEDLRWRSTTSS